MNTTAAPTAARNFSFSFDNLTVLLNGKAFFASPIANPCMAYLRKGLKLPNVGALKGANDVFPGYHVPYWGSARTEIIVGGGNCCDGYLIGLNEEAKITKILAIDFNISQIVPIIHSVPTDSPEGGEEFRIGLLVSGSGCSGKGVRFVDFYPVTPTSTPVTTLHERSHEAWLYGADPLTAEGIWEGLEKIGIKADKDKTEMALKAFSKF